MAMVGFIVILHDILGGDFDNNTYVTSYASP